jgi:hypothetical protein
MFRMGSSTDLAGTIVQPDLPEKATLVTKRGLKPLHPLFADRQLIPAVILRILVRCGFGTPATAFDPGKPLAEPIGVI